MYFKSRGFLKNIVVKSSSLSSKDIFNKNMKTKNFFYYYFLYNLSGKTKNIIKLLLNICLFIIINLILNFRVF